MSSRGSIISWIDCLPAHLCAPANGPRKRKRALWCQRLINPSDTETPFASAPGPDVVSVYANDGPFELRLRWLSTHESVDDEAAVRDIDGIIGEAMGANNAEGADRSYVALLGLRAKSAAAAAARATAGARGEGVPCGGGKDRVFGGWKFAVVLAARAPLVNLKPSVFKSSLLNDTSQIGLSGPPDVIEIASKKHVLRMLSIHVYGLTDLGLHLTRLVQLDGNGRALGHDSPLRGLYE
ncbi:hypothetical protein F5X98DRAFT_368589 [Xylaria grammica]|nr:hypothetical protein F5X98DRAFT_368589 [Xylaria grammica]